METQELRFPDQIFGVMERPALYTSRSESVRFLDEIEATSVEPDEIRRSKKWCRGERGSGRH